MHVRIYTQENTIKEGLDRYVVFLYNCGHLLCNGSPNQQLLPSAVWLQRPQGPQGPQPEGILFPQTPTLSKLQWELVEISVPLKN